jgi:hypothetical protein
MSGNALVVQGGRLIDATGRAPIDNSVIVIPGRPLQSHWQEW